MLKLLSHAKSMKIMSSMATGPQQFHNEKPTFFQLDSPSKMSCRISLGKANDEDLKAFMKLHDSVSGLMREKLPYLLYRL